MKNKITSFVLLFCLFAFVYNAKAQQLPNASFESWQSGDKVPVSWEILSISVPFLGTVTSKSEKIDDAQLGLSAIKLTSEANAISQGEPVPGFLSLGKMDIPLAQIMTLIGGGDIDPLSLEKYFNNGYKIQGIPEKISGYYKATGATPTMVSFARKNGVVVTTAAPSNLGIPSNYTKFTMNFTDTETIPDTLFIAFLAGQTAGATLTLDSLSITYRLYVEGVKAQYYSKAQKTNDKNISFNCLQKDYYDTVEYSVDSIQLTTLNAFPIGSTASIVNNSRYLAAGNTTSFTAKVQDATDENRFAEFELHVYRKPIDPSIKKIVLNAYQKGGTLIKSNFEATYDQGTYYASVTNQVDSVGISCELTYPDDTEYEIINSIDSLLEGENKFIISVKEKGNVSNTVTDTLIVKRLGTASVLSADSTLNNLTIIAKGEAIFFSPVFHKDSTYYIVDNELSYFDSEIEILAQPTNHYASVLGVGPISLTTGKNICNIEVIAENEIAKRIYKIEIIRNEGKNANLKSLSISSNGTNIPFSPVFNADSLSYYASVVDSISEVEIEYEVEDENSVVITGKLYNANPSTLEGKNDILNIKGVKIYTIDNGENKFYLEVTAADGLTINRYNLIISKITTTVEKVPESNNISIYPNPATDFLKIEGVSKSAKVEIYDIAGNFVGKETCDEKSEINVSKYSRGIYILKIYAKDKVFVKGLILK